MTTMQDERVAPSRSRHRRWLIRAALAAAVTALTAMAWAGYRTADAQLALAALWSICGPANR